MANLGCVIVVFIVSWSIGVITHANFGSIVKVTDNLIEQCELGLPRNKHCVLKAELFIDVKKE